MKKKRYVPVCILLLLIFFLTPLAAQTTRPDWASVTAPVITGIDLSQTDAHVITIEFDLPTDTKTADSGYVTMTSDDGTTVQNAVGKTRKAAKKTDFTPSHSGTYTFTVTAQRKDETEVHQSESVSFDFTLPLEQPSLSIMNKGNGQLSIDWTEVNEAEKYILSYTGPDGILIALPATANHSLILPDFSVGEYYTFAVTAVRGTEQKTSQPLTKLVKSESERVWTFAEFGTSTKPEINRMEMIDPNDLKFKLYSCTYDQKTGNIDTKGGKFTAFFDGVSYYYTVIDPDKENFELTATVTIDYINPIPDGQEGFGLLAMDSLGIDGTNMITHYTNSAGIISWKYTTHINGVKKEIRAGLGARFTSGLTPEVLALGDSGIAENGICVSNAFSYDTSDTVRTGDVYRITLKKDNTGYHAIYRRAIASEDTIEEFIMYDGDKLRQLDKDHVYVGFVTARGCNATFSDIVFTTSAPALDPPAEAEPAELVPLEAGTDCPSAWYNTEYPFVYTANCDGNITVKTTKGAVLIDNAPVKADEDFKQTITLNTKGFTDMLVTFKPLDSYMPEQNKVMAQYNQTLKAYEENYNAVTQTLSVIVRNVSGSEIYVSPSGDAFGKGTREKPLDITSALNYVSPGQTIMLLPGTYYMNRPVKIERGRNGTETERIVLKGENAAEHVVFDFSNAGGGFELWGNYWTLENLDVTHTPENCKGLTIFGNNNIISHCDAYICGDTGIQISGRSTDASYKWPHDNLVEYCESFGNCDPAQNNADGFAAKLTVGTGNRFYGCVAHHNIDDGWDLYSKIETGPIGAVIIENCITYKNGTRMDGTGRGDGNGFKMGGDGIAVEHILRNCIVWGCEASGITSNSNPALQIEDVISFGNGSYNITLYGKGTDTARSFKADGVISLEGGDADNYREMPSLASNTNWFFNGAVSVNKAGTVITRDIFALRADGTSTADCSFLSSGYKADGTYNRFPRNEDGSFDFSSVFVLK